MVAAFDKEELFWGEAFTLLQDAVETLEQTIPPPSLEDFHRVWLRLFTYLMAAVESKDSWKKVDPYDQDMREVVELVTVQMQDTVGTLDYILALEVYENCFGDFS